MDDKPKETIRNRGCPCGWPIDSCNPKFNDQSSESRENCPKAKHDREVGRFKAKEGLEAKARDHDREAAFYRRTADLVEVREP